MRTLTKEVKHTIDETEYTFQIRKMDALSSSVLLKLVLEKLMPVMSKVQGVFNAPEEGKKVDEVAAQRTQNVMTLIPEVLGSMTEEELIGLERRCLKNVDVLFPVGWRPLLEGTTFTLEELEYDVVTMLILCYEVIDFNTESFFGGNSLSSLLKNRNT